ncbi:hypothetical protein OMO38_05660 [Chryseobacterium sp. 09-1422]|mgnify:CR=1 FL=1|uniref:Uncharacterized protein n=1 Tax=Chryseobacterium kimseyorum TaxID=2984028 RepID=A0ABT3HW60_9FLAO|nr:hypothetical protein [Chryseobacterium kimseyorum]MCW3168009.1 hypothetical protein [Chryseobacterium kimseyorum]
MKNIFLILLCSFSAMAYSQKPTELEWTISFKKNHVIFECSKGCNYSYLSFDAYKKVVLNENAMANLEKNPDEENSNFLVQYSKKGNQINLEGIKGVDWKNITLTRDLKSKYYINQTGEIRKTTL